MKLEYQDEFVNVLLDAGVRLKKGEELAVVMSKVGEEQGELIKEAAFKRGAKAVHINYGDVDAEFAHYASGRTDKFNWLTEEHFEEPLSRGSKLLLIRSDEFGLFEKLDEKATALRARYYYFEDYYSRIYKVLKTGSSMLSLACLPNISWGEHACAGFTGEAACNELWRHMYKACYLDSADPVGKWIDTGKKLADWSEILTGNCFDALHIVGEGTDLMVGLPKKQVWEGGEIKFKTGEKYIVGIPTEETFTTPRTDGVDGHITIRRKFYYDGCLTNGLELYFKGGNLVDVNCEGKELEAHMRAYLKNTPNYQRLGEIAIVPEGTGVNNEDFYFYDMAYDENACCHMALGSSYRQTIQGGEFMTDEQFAAEGANLCDKHSDIMFDSYSMMIYGVKNGRETPVLDHGNFVLKA